MPIAAEALRRAPSHSEDEASHVGTVAIMFKPDGSLEAGALNSTRFTRRNLPPVEDFGSVMDTLAEMSKEVGVTRVDAAAVLASDQTDGEQVRKLGIALDSEGVVSRLLVESGISQNNGEEAEDPLLRGCRQVRRSPVVVKIRGDAIAERSRSQLLRPEVGRTRVRVGESSTNPALTMTTPDSTNRRGNFAPSLRGRGSA